MVQMKVLNVLETVKIDAQNNITYENMGWEFLSVAMLFGDFIKVKIRKENYLRISKLQANCWAIYNTTLHNSSKWWVVLGLMNTQFFGCYVQPKWSKVPLIIGRALMAILAIMQILALELALGLRERDRAIRQGKFLCCFSLAGRPATTEWKKRRRWGEGIPVLRGRCHVHLNVFFHWRNLHTISKTKRKTQSKEKPKVVRKLYAKFTWRGGGGSAYAKIGVAWRSRRKV